jgi:heme-degrading monooxygenase HmoA
MYVVAVDIAVQSGAEQELARLFEGPFLDAISAQNGFVSVSLLKPTTGLDYLLIISFASQPLQEQWVASDLHGELWSAMEAHFVRYDVRTFNALQKGA